MATNTRKYSPIWNRLKEDKKVSIRVHCKMKKTLIKAVYEEKRIDFAWKLERDLAGLPKLVISSKASEPDVNMDIIISLTLVTPVKYKGLNLEDLA